MVYKLTWNHTELEKDTIKETLGRLTKALKLLRDTAKSKVAVSDDPHKFRGKVYAPGTLKKSIGFRIKAVNSFRDEFEGRVGVGVVYGIFQELGPVTGKVNYHRSQKRILANRKWKFKPFLRPSFHEKEDELKKILGVNQNIFASTGLNKAASVLLE